MHPGAHAQKGPERAPSAVQLCSAGVGAADIGARRPMGPAYRSACIWAMIVGDTASGPPRITRLVMAFPVS